MGIVGGGIKILMPPPDISSMRFHVNLPLSCELHVKIIVFAGGLNDGYSMGDNYNLVFFWVFNRDNLTY
jgi:hypothetical protein